MKKKQIPVNLTIYLGSGKKGLRLRENLEKATRNISISEYIMERLKIIEPKLFEGVEYGK